MQSLRGLRSYSPRPFRKSQRPPPLRKTQRLRRKVALRLKRKVALLVPAKYRHRFCRAKTFKKNKRRAAFQPAAETWDRLVRKRSHQKKNDAAAACTGRRSFRFLRMRKTSH